MVNRYKLKEVTPQEMRCGIGLCPAIYKARDVTPQTMRCIGGGCPSTRETEDGSYLIVGQRVNPAEVGLAEKVGAGEVLIRVPRKLIDDKRD